MKTAFGMPYENRREFLCEENMLEMAVFRLDHIQNCHCSAEFFSITWKRLELFPFAHCMATKLILPEKIITELLRQ